MTTGRINQVTTVRCAFPLRIPHHHFYAKMYKRDGVLFQETKQHTFEPWHTRRPTTKLLANARTRARGEFFVELCSQVNKKMNNDAQQWAWLLAFAWEGNVGLTPCSLPSNANGYIPLPICQVYENFSWTSTNTKEHISATNVHHINKKLNYW